MGHVLFIHALISGFIHQINLPSTLHLHLPSLDGLPGLHLQHRLLYVYSDYREGVDVYVIKFIQLSSLFSWYTLTSDILLVFWYIFGRSAFVMILLVKISIQG